MKNVFATILGISMSLTATAQQQITLPYSTNQFITGSNINWASDIKAPIAFENARPIKGTNIYNYIIRQAVAGKLKVGAEGWTDLAGDGNNPLLLSPYTKMTAKPQPAIPVDIEDPAKRFVIHEIMYLDNYRLKSVVIAAAPLINTVTSTGLSIGYRNAFFCCGEGKPNKKASKLILLQSIRRRIDPDSLENMGLLKQTFGLSLSQALWYGASQNNGTLTDIIDKKKIAPKEVMNYGHGDTIVVPIYDNDGNATSSKTVPPSPIFPNALYNYIEVIENIYFNPALNSFYTEIKECFLFVKSRDSLGDETTASEKRFRLVFHAPQKKPRKP